MVETIIDLVMNGLIYISLGAMLSWFFYSFRKKDLLGGFTGGLIVAFLGTTLGGFILRDIVIVVLNFLQNGLGKVNVVAALIGGYLALHIYNKINHDKKRKDY